MFLNKKLLCLTLFYLSVFSSEIDFKRLENEKQEFEAIRKKTDYFMLLIKMKSDLCDKLEKFNINFKDCSSFGLEEIHREKIYSSLVKFIKKTTTELEKIQEHLNGVTVLKQKITQIMLELEDLAFVNQPLKDSQGITKL